MLRITTLSLLGALALAGAGCNTADASPAPRAERRARPAQAAEARAEVERVSGARAHQLVDEGAQLLDVRTPGEFASGHPDPAMNIPVDQVDARLAELDRTRPVVVYCQSGRRSAAAAEVLTAAGYTVYDLGGVARWQ
jgi:rhodanese-related sulfurtransferase